MKKKIVFIYPTYSKTSVGITSKNLERALLLRKLGDVKPFFLTNDLESTGLSEVTLVKKRESKGIKFLMRLPILWRVTTIIFLSYNMYLNLVKLVNSCRWGNTLYMRYQGSSLWSYLFYKWLRFKGIKQILIEFNSIRTNDIKAQNDLMFRKKLLTFLESIWFKITYRQFVLVTNSVTVLNHYKQLGCKQAAYWGNGVNFNNVSPIKNRALTDTINLVFVSGTYNPMHGLERYVESLKAYRGKKTISIRWIGKVSETRQLKALKNPKVFQEFYPVLEKEELEKHYSWAHGALGSIAFYKQGLFETSDLKTKEYLAYGIPTIVAHKDTDISLSCCSYLYQIKNNEEVFSFDEFTLWLEHKYKDDTLAQKIQNEAKKSFDYDVLTNNFLKEIND